MSGKLSILSLLLGRLWLRGRSLRLLRGCRWLKDKDLIALLELNDYKYSDFFLAGKAVLEAEGALAVSAANVLETNGALPFGTLKNI